MMQVFARWLDRRTRGAAGTLRLVGATPLFGGGAVHVADIDGRRIVFASSPHALCLLAAYPHAEPSTVVPQPGYGSERT